MTEENPLYPNYSNSKGYGLGTGQAQALNFGVSFLGKYHFLQDEWSYWP